MQCCYQHSFNFSAVLVHKMQQVLDIQIDKPQNLPTADTCHCYVCVENSTGKTKCSKCSQIICKYNMKSICEMCKDF